MIGKIYVQYTAADHERQSIDPDCIEICKKIDQEVVPVQREVNCIREPSIW